MSVITGTPWDLALNQRAYRAPIVDAPIGTGSAGTGPIAAGSPSAASRPAAATVADAASPTGQLSARAAYQQSLYQRASIVDIRTGDERARTGHLREVPQIVEIDPAELIVWLVQHDSDPPVILLSQDGAEAAAVSTALAEVDLADVAHIYGGFLAWQQAGLPVRRP